MKDALVGLIEDVCDEETLLSPYPEAVGIAASTAAIIAELLTFASFITCDVGALIFIPNKPFLPLPSGGIVGGAVVDGV